MTATTRALCLAIEARLYEWGFKYDDISDLDIYVLADEAERNNLDLTEYMGDITASSRNNEDRLRKLRSYIDIARRHIA